MQQGHDTIPGMLPRPLYSTHAAADHRREDALDPGMAIKCEGKEARSNIADVAFHASSLICL